MLIRFSVENYKSFKERQIFSMVAGKQTRHPTHCLHIDDKQLLKSSFFFGANASGKSNFVRAIDFMRTVVVKGTNTIRYSDLSEIIETDTNFYLMLGKNQGSLLNKNDCSEELINFLHRKAEEIKHRK